MIFIFAWLILPDSGPAGSLCIGTADGVGEGGQLPETTGGLGVMPGMLGPGTGAS